MMDQDDIEEPVKSAVQNVIQDENSSLNISDVIEVIQTTDPTAQAMFNNVNDVIGNQSSHHLVQQQPQQTPNGSHLTNNNNKGSGNSSKRRNAYVKITEQPASKALRFRYECEGRCAGSIPGVNSTQDNKTFPSIQVVGYKGRAVVVVSCVTKDPPYRPHPHNLVGKEGCKKGVCTVEINSNTMSVSFSSLGIQCVKKRDIEEALRIREEIRVDPFRTGFSHRSQPSSLDLNAVRLCFQVFLESDQPGRFTVPLTPVVSDPIFDKKAMSDLIICKLSDVCCTVAGGKEMILLCEKVAKEDISVRFFEEQNGNLVWEDYGDFTHTNVHKQVAISFRTPKYKTLDIERSIKCYIQLKRPSDGVTSESLPFEYLPLDADPIELKRKRIKSGNEASLYAQLNINEHQFDARQTIQNITDATIKSEPVDNNSLSPYHTPYGRMSLTTSPQPCYSPLGTTVPSYYGAPNSQLSPTYSYLGQQTYQDQQTQSHHTDNAQINNFNIQTTTGIGRSSILLPSLLSNITALSTSPPPSAMEQQNNFDPPKSGINITANSSIGNLIESTGVANLSSLLDMDSQKFTHINSAELAGLLDGTLASVVNEQQQQQQNTNCTQVNMQVNDDHDNMTDSFTKFAINDLNDF